MKWWKKFSPWPPLSLPPSAEPIQSSFRPPTKETPTVLARLGNSENIGIWTLIEFIFLPVCRKTHRLSPNRTRGICHEFDAHRPSATEIDQYWKKVSRKYETLRISPVSSGPKCQLAGRDATMQSSNSLSVGLSVSSHGFRLENSIEI